METGKSIAILVALGLALVGVVGDSFVKRASTDPQAIHWAWLVAGALIYAATAIGWVFVMRHLKLSTIGVYYSIGTILFLIASGVFFFHETLSLVELGAVIMAITSLILLSNFS